MWHAQARAIAFYNAWKVCFVIRGITCSCWLLGKAGIQLKHPGNARFELQIVDVPHGQEDFINGDGPFFEVQQGTYIMQSSMIRSYNGGSPTLGYSTISGHRCTFLPAEHSTREIGKMW